MNLDDQLRSVLNEAAGTRTARPPDVAGLISGGQARRRRRNAVWAGGCVLAAVVALGGGYGLAQIGDDEADSNIPVATTPTPEALPKSDIEPVEPGTYLIPADSEAVVTAYTITVPAGWYGGGVGVGKHQEDLSGSGHEEDAIGIDSFVLDKIRLTDNTCTGPERLGKAQTSVAGLVAGLRAQGSGPRVSDPVATTVGGLPATRIDLDYPGSRPLSNCRLSDIAGVEKGVLQVWFGYFVLFPTESASAYVVDLGSRAQVFMVRTAAAASAADRLELQSILDSISFQADG